MATIYPHMRESTRNDETNGLNGRWDIGTVLEHSGYNYLKGISRK